MIRLFVDDLEEGIQKEKKLSAFNLLNPAANGSTDRYIEDYLETHVSIKIDGKAIPLHYLGHEREGAAIIAYAECVNIKKWNQLSFSCTILMAQFADQSNLVHVQVGEKIKSARLVQDKTSEVFSFNP